MQLFRGGLVFKAHRLLYHSTLGVRVIKKENNRCHHNSFSFEHSTVRSDPRELCSVCQRWGGAVFDVLVGRSISPSLLSFSSPLLGKLGCLAYKKTHPLGPCRRPVPRVVGGSYGGVGGSHGRGTHVLFVSVH